MPINNEVTGDLLDMADNGDFDAIVHGCNCFCNMGAGIAKQIKQRYPSAFEADCETESGDIAKLGTFTIASVGRFEVVNAYTQFKYGGKKSNADYSAIHSAFESINSAYDYGAKIGIPLIGAGLAGGDWKVISDHINQVTSNLDITVVRYG